MLVVEFPHGPWIVRGVVYRCGHMSIWYAPGDGFAEVVATSDGRCGRCLGHPSQTWRPFLARWVNP